MEGIRRNPFFSRDVEKWFYCSILLPILRVFAHGSIIIAIKDSAGDYRVRVSVRPCQNQNNISRNRSSILDR